ncbi:MAG: peptidyl-prolyl cis-trans isomerase [Gemmatimonadota bacterium]
MMQQLRDSTKIIMILVSISFVGLMVFEWGMDFSGRGPGGSGSPTRLGSVNGAEISIDEYQRQYRLLYEQAQQQAPDGTLSAEQQSQLEEEAWEAVVDFALLQREATRRDLSVTDTELIEFIRSNPPRDVINLPAFQTDGQFDIEKYRRALADPALAPTWAEYESQLRVNLPLQKLQEQVVAGVNVTDAELLETYRSQNEQARIQYLVLDPDRLVSDNQVSVTDAEIQQAYESNRERYYRDPSARISYVSFRPAVSAADSARVKSRADSLARAAALPDADFAAIARDESDDVLTRDNGGELGWFAPASMAPAFQRAVEDLEKGQVSPAVLTEFGYHIIKLEDRLDEDGDTRLRARHILLQIDASAAARDAAREAARAFAQDASTDGADFSAVAAEHGVEPTQSPLFEDGLVIPGIGPARDLAEFAFANDPGAVSGSLEHDGAFFVLRVDDRYPAGYVALEQVAESLRTDLIREKKQAAVREMVPEIQAVVQNGGLEAAAQQFGLEVETSNLFTRLNNIRGIGSGTAVAGAAFGLAQGQLAGPIEATRGLYFIRLLEKQPYDSDAFARERESLLSQLRVTKMREVFETWFDDLREQAEVEDNRAQILGTT